MTETVLASATKEVVIGFDRPFVIIGERINPTGRKILAESKLNIISAEGLTDAAKKVVAAAGKA